MAPINYPTELGGAPQSVVAADLRNDGRLDLVVADNGDVNDSAHSGVVVLLGNGDGTFQPAVHFDAGPHPAAVVVGDLNGDGIPDIVVANAGSVTEGHTVRVLLGNGDGTFQSPRTFQVGRNPTSVALGDLRGDGRLDIVTANGGSDTVSVLLGNGDGSFQNAVSFPVGVNPTAVALGDLRGDGRLDIVTANAGFTDIQGSVSVLLNDGDGTFQPAAGYSLGAPALNLAARDVALGDFTSDGQLDVVTANNSGDGGSFSLLVGNGDGTFQTGVEHAVPASPLSIAAADLNNDGTLDLIMATFLGHESNLDEVLGNGDGTFQAPVTIGAGKLPASVAVGDFQGNGTLDLAVANASGDDVSVILGNGDGTFQTAPTFATDSGPAAIAKGDLRGNSIQDLVTANSNSNTVSVLLGNGDGTFQTSVNYVAGPGPHSVALADLTGNGILDIVVVNSSVGPVFQGTVTVLLGNGDGTFQTPLTSVIRGQSDFPESLAIGDLNGDGIPDLAVTEEFIDPQTNGLISAVNVLRGNGDGTFQRVNTVAFGFGVQPQTIVIADFNHDGANDIAFGDRDGVVVIPGRGDFSFRTGTILPGTTAFPRGLATADLRGNGILDLVASNFFDDIVTVTLGNGDGTFQPAVSYRIGGASVAVTVGDVNGDGIPDIVAANATDNSVSVLLGNGDGTFQRETRYLVGTGPESVVVGDFTGNGSQGIAVGNALSNSVSVLLSRNDGTGLRTRAAGRHLREVKARNGVGVVPFSSAALAQAARVVARDALFSVARSQPAGAGDRSGSISEFSSLQTAREAGHAGRRTANFGKGFASETNGNFAATARRSDPGSLAISDPDFTPGLNTDDATPDGGGPASLGSALQALG
jgi:hypothetical protein